MKCHSALLPLLCLALLSAPANAGNPLSAIGSGLKKAGSALSPWKKPVEPPKVIPPAKSASARPAKKVVKSSPSPVVRKKSSSGSESTPRRKISRPQSGRGDTAESPSRKMPPAAGETSVKSQPSGSPTAAGPAAALVSDTPPGPAPAPAPALTPPPVPAEIPFATPVMGRKGYVRSPFADDKGMVDVNEIPAGTKVKCPFSGQIFRVP